jgi:C4-dicarboxylate-specific signal transduction histidine kinase
MAASAKPGSDAMKNGNEVQALFEQISRIYDLACRIDPQLALEKAGFAEGGSYLGHANLLDKALACLEQAVEKGEEYAKALDEERGKAAYAAKMATLGEMAAGVAHEINTPLAIIAGNAEQVCEMLAEEKIDFPMVKWLCDKSRDTAYRITGIVKGLRALARDGRHDAHMLVPASRVVEDCLNLCQERFKNRGIPLRISVPEPSVKLECRSTQVMQILVNLLNNAFDAVRDSFEPWVALEARDLGEAVEFSVANSGPAIPQKIRDKIFKPFFTTKPMGQGTGLGLSVSKNIAEDHGGILALDEASPRTRFVLKLPKRHSTPASEENHDDRKTVSA